MKRSVASKLGRTSITALLLALATIAPSTAQDDTLPDLPIIGGPFTHPVEPGRPDLHFNLGDKTIVVLKDTP